MAEQDLVDKLKLARLIHADVPSNDISDITDNLKSLQFEDALSEDEHNLIYIRKKSHALTATICAQIIYFVTVLNDARQIERQLNMPAEKKKSRLLQKVTDTNPLNIGIIGCGRLGKHIADCLLSYGEVSPDYLTISTRRPETLSDLKTQEVECINNNRKVAESCDLIFLCVLPSQLTSVADEIRGHLQTHSIVYSLLAATPPQRLQKLLSHNNLMRPVFEWQITAENNDDFPWNVSEEISACYHRPDDLVLTCPYASSTRALVRTGESLGEQMIYALINMCTFLGMNRMQAVGTLNAAMLGHSVRTPVKRTIKKSEITKMISPDTDKFAIFDLSAVEGRKTPITQVLAPGENVREQLVSQYLHLFSRHLNWRRKALLQHRKQLIFAID